MTPKLMLSQSIIAQPQEVLEWRMVFADKMSSGVFTQYGCTGKDIAKLFVVTFNNHLTLTTNVEKSVLWWEKISTLMTDSVAKKFQTENLITATLSSQHIPFHLLCVLHTYEAFDAWNLNALKLVQQKFNWRNMVINCTSTVHKFCGKCALSAVIIVLCKLVSNDGHKSSLYMINLKTFSRR